MHHRVPDGFCLRRRHLKIDGASALSLMEESMKVKNTTDRLIHVGDVSIVPGEEAVIPKAFEGSIDGTGLVEVKTVGRPPKEQAEGEGK